MSSFLSLDISNAPIENDLTENGEFSLWSRRMLDEESERFAVTLYDTDDLQEFCENNITNLTIKEVPSKPCAASPIYYNTSDGLVGFYHNACPAGCYCPDRFYFLRSI